VPRLDTTQTPSRSWEEPDGARRFSLRGRQAHGEPLFTLAALTGDDGHHYSKNNGNRNQFYQTYSEHGENWVKGVLR
jgi:hypothetical protein